MGFLVMHDSMACLIIHSFGRRRTLYIIAISTVPLEESIYMQCTLCIHAVLTQDYQSPSLLANTTEFDDLDMRLIGSTLHWGPPTTN